MVLARDFSRQHRIIHFASIGSASGLRLYELRICLQLALHPYPRTTNAWAGLPSCVIPSLDYYQEGSRESPHPAEAFCGFRRLALPGLVMGEPKRVREYQPVVHRLRLSASP